MRKWLFWAAAPWLAATLFLAACGAATGKDPRSNAKSVHSGISARVVEGPTCPVERVPPDPRCAPHPLSAPVRIRRSGSSGPGQVIRSGADGRFRVRLAPGRYAVQPLPRGGSPFPRPGPAQTVDVHSGRFVHITITYDTGIR